MKILMLVNWKIEYATSTPSQKQPPDYVVVGEPYWFFRYFEDRNVQVDVVDCHSFAGLEKFEKEKIRFYIWQTLKVLPRLKQYDLVLSHGMQSGIVLCLLRRLFGKGNYKHVVFDIGAFNSARESGKALKLMQFASKSLDGVIYHTASQIEYYRKCHPWLVERCEYITFGTDVDFFAEEGTVSAKRNQDATACQDETVPQGKKVPQEKKVQQNERDSRPYILCAGYHQRDWNTLLKAYARTSGAYRLKLIGNADLGIQEPGVEVHKSVPVEAFKEQIREAAFCVLPLEDLNFSFGQMTLLQQMAMGKAVVTANVPSVRAYLQHGAVVQYESGDEKELAYKLEQLMESPSLCEEIGNQAAKLVRREFNEQLMAAHIEMYLHQLMQES